jgi:hypothetical protein
VPEHAKRIIWHDFVRAGDGRELTVEAHHRLGGDLYVKVGPTLGEHMFESCIYINHWYAYRQPMAAL